MTELEVEALRRQAAELRARADRLERAGFVKAAAALRREADDAARSALSAHPPHVAP